MTKEYSNKNLQKASFKNEDLSNASFVDSDLRGADFTNANLIGANFTHSRTGITPLNTIIILFIALMVSLLSGYVAALTGQTVQNMFASEDPNIRTAGIVTIVIILLFILYYYWKGGGNAISHLILPVVILAGVIGFIAYVSGLGTGMGMFYLILSLLLTVVMFIVGTLARAAAGTLSNILFMIVALSGGMFGKSVGGGIGTVAMAIACALISKRALSGAKGFDTLRKIASFLVIKFGTSFRNAKLSNANFTGAKVHNSDFSNADLSGTNWEGSKKINFITTTDKFTPKKKI